MIPGLGGLSPAGLERLKETLCMDHNVMVLVSLMDINHNHLADLTHMLYDGQVQISTTAGGPTRSSRLQIWDPDNITGLNDMSPDAQLLYYRKMIRITYCVWRYGDLKSVDIPLFTGPIVDSGINSNGLLEVNCLGKESLLNTAAVWKPAAWPKGYNVGTALRTLLRDRGGEVHFDFETTSVKFGAKYQIAREAIIWDEAQKLARKCSKQLFYDGRGVSRFRSLPSTSATVAFRFRDGPGGSIITSPLKGSSDTEIKNTAWVIGAAPKGSKTIPSSVLQLPSSNHLNPWAMGRKVGSTTIPRVLLEKIEDTTLTKKAQTNARAAQTLDKYDDQQATLKADVLTIPFLEELDLITFTVSGEYDTSQRVQDLTFPLIGPVCSWGSQKNISLKKKK